jgi:hypothetical protein
LVELLYIVLVNIAFLIKSCIPKGRFCGPLLGPFFPNPSPALHTPQQIVLETTTTIGFLAYELSLLGNSSPGGEYVLVATRRM